MLRIQPSPDRAGTKTTPNLLPCQIHLDGPVNNPCAYWKPKVKVDGTHEAYLRGRRLQGREVKLPAGYEGIVVQSAQPQERDAKDLMYIDQDEEEGEEEAGVLEQVGEFDRVVVWDHEKVVEDDDAFVKGVNEWVGFAETLHQPGKVAEGGKS